MIRGEAAWSFPGLPDHNDLSPLSLRALSLTFQRKNLIVCRYDWWYTTQKFWSLKCPSMMMVSESAGILGTRFEPPVAELVKNKGNPRLQYAAKCVQSIRLVRQRTYIAIPPGRRSRATLQCYWKLIIKLFIAMVGVVKGVFPSPSGHACHQRTKNV